MVVRFPFVRPDPAVQRGTPHDQRPTKAGLTQPRRVSSQLILMGQEYNGKADAVEVCQNRCRPSP
jgi:hypothetical protein